jgi:hypothetical protein
MGAIRMVRSEIYPPHISSTRTFRSTISPSTRWQIPHIIFIIRALGFLEETFKFLGNLGRRG